MRTDVLTEAFTTATASLALRFSCGNMGLDSFLKSDDAMDNNIGKTFVWLNSEKNEIIGYYNMGVGYIDMQGDNGKYKLGGSIHLNFFALAQKYRGVVVNESPSGEIVKMSDILFNDFLERAVDIRENHVGFTFVTLAATKEGESLYHRFGFEKLDDDLHFSLKDDEAGCNPMYLVLDKE